MRERFPTKSHYTWSHKDPAATVYVRTTETTSTTTALVCVVAGEEYPLTVPFTDAAYLEDVACCLTLVAALAPQLLTVPEAWRALTSISMRLEVKDGLQGNTLIDDAYSCDLQSLSIALDFLRRRASATGARPVLLLSDMGGSGRSDAALYTGVAGLIQSYGVDETLTLLMPMMLND